MLGAIIYVKFLDNSRIIKLIASFFFAFFVGFALNLTLRFNKCPECYGTDFCRYFQSRQVRLTWDSYLFSLINPKYTKSMYYGILNNSKPIVIKNKARKPHKPQNSDLNSEKVQNVILCPGFDNLEFLLSHVNERISNEHLWMDIENSIEPLLLMYLKPYNWPVPRIYGTCGNFIINEYKGEPIGNFLSSTFEKQAYLSLNLLKMAQLFTFEHPDFIFYFTDYSVYNFVVDKNGKISIVDLDNVVLFNKSATRDIAHQNKVHVSESFDEDEYTFSAPDICSHYLSDHNFYSVCKFMLTHPKYGLLRQLPEHVRNSNKNLVELLNECATPTTSDRINASQKLQAVLTEIIKDYTWKSN